jgi:hypothetical protein
MALGDLFRRSNDSAPTAPAEVASFNTTLNNKAYDVNDVGSIRSALVREGPVDLDDGADSGARGRHACAHRRICD